MTNYLDSKQYEKELNTNQIIQAIYKTRSVVGNNGKRHELHSEIDREEGEFLFRLKFF